jgi:hypothetical protein
VELLRPSTEEEMVLAFLRAEIESPTYRDNILRVPWARHVIDDGDPTSDEENAARRVPSARKLCAPNDSRRDGVLTTWLAWAADKAVRNCASERDEERWLTA